ncbi:MAG: type I-U CRISPR-associated helicase/endonuclease Cas3 [Gammaproteobacteria bacterium]|nr:type I-U CRISPR-associated helicase/endonuclease Cas3 [Gammaproteobacteria bacterium]
MNTDWLRCALGLHASEAPFPWQVELLRRFCGGEEVSLLDIPTGLGKTAVMAVWLVARALGAALPRRLVYVVDRRAVVDQATEVAESLRAWVANERGVADALDLHDCALPISTLRGQHVDNRAWLEDPSSPAIIIGTVDMVGSRLLFSGYGVSSKMRPYHASLLGADTFVVLDEAHLVPTFEDLLRQVERGADSFGPNEPSLRGLAPEFKLLSLSATGRQTDATTLILSDDDRSNPIVKKRLTAKKALSIVDLGKNADDADEATKKNKGPKLAGVLAKQAWEVTTQGSAQVRCLVFCDARKDATAVAAKLRNLAKSATAPEPTIELFVGGRRVKERTQARDALARLGFLAGTATNLERSAFLIATSAGEVGVDLDADHMVCDLVAWERMVQRLGRVNRRGDGDAKVVVVVDSEPARPTTKAKEALAERLAKRDAAMRAFEERPGLQSKIEQLEAAEKPKDNEVCALRDKVKELDDKIAAIKAEKRAIPTGKKGTPQDRARREALQQEEKALGEEKKAARERLKAAQKVGKERLKLEVAKGLDPLKSALKNCDDRIKAFKDSDAKTVARHEADVAMHRALRTLLDAVANDGGSLSPDALLKLRARQDLADALRAATTVEPLRPELTRPLVDAWSMTSLDEHPGRPEIDPWLRGFRLNDPPHTTVVWRRHLPVRADGSFDAKAAKRFFEAAPPHTSEQLETETHLVLDWLIERAATVAAAAGEALLEAKQVVAVALGRRGEPKGWRTLSQLAAAKSKGKNKKMEAKKAREQGVKELEKLLIGATLVIDARLGGLTDGLLNEKTNTTAEASDDGSTTWLARPDVADVPVTGFRIRVLGTDEEDESAWRTTPGAGWVRRHLFVTKVLDGEPSAALVIDGWAGDAATEEERAEADRPQQLDEHQSWAEDCARQIAQRLGISDKWTELLALSARLHDEGKRAAQWQNAFGAPADGRPYAKTRGPINFDLLDGYRHELGSLPYVEAHDDFKALGADDQEFVLHLVAAHHGYARPAIGVRGSDLPPPSITDEWGRDIALRFARLSRRWGPWGLAWWEALLRSADQTASRRNQQAATAKKEQKEQEELP